MAQRYDFSKVDEHTPATKMPTIGFVGAGKGGQTLAAALALRGVRVVAVASRSRQSAERLAGLTGAGADVVCENPAQVAANAQLTFLTVPDDAIQGAVDGVCREDGWQHGHAVVHCSGALPSSVLSCAHTEGSPVGSFHPLQAFATPPVDAEEAASRVRGIVFGLEGDEILRPTLERLAVILEGVPLWLKPEDKTLYHAAAVISSNYAVTLLATAATLLSHIGISREQALAALLPLLRGTLRNIETQGIPDALTGPIARGDSGTVARHLQRLDATDPFIADLYRALGAATIPTALERSPDNTAGIAEIAQLLQNGSE